MIEKPRMSQCPSWDTSHGGQVLGRAVGSGQPHPLAWGVIPSHFLASSCHYLSHSSPYTPTRHLPFCISKDGTVTGEDAKRSITVACWATNAEESETACYSSSEYQWLPEGQTEFRTRSHLRNLQGWFPVVVSHLASYILPVQVGWDQPSLWNAVVWPHVEGSRTCCVLM